MLDKQTKGGQKQSLQYTRKLNIIKLLNIKHQLN